MGSEVLIRLVCQLHIQMEIFETFDITYQKF